MKKSNIYKLFIFTICLALVILSFPSKVNAANEDSSSSQPRLVDDADLLSDSEEKALTKKVDKISKDNKCDVVIVTVDSLDDKTATEYADDYFDNNGYGYGTNKDGILFFISMDNRDWAISTHGYGITAFTDAGQSYIVDKIKDSLSNGKYDKAFNGFADYCDDFIKEARDGKPYDTNHMPKEMLSLWWIPGSIGIGAVIALIITLVMKKSLTTVEMQRTANNYVVNGSLNLTNSNDVFLYRNVTRTAKPKDDGGSSTHSSSSGETHGGSSGKF